MNLKSLYEMCINGFVGRAPVVQWMDSFISIILDIQ